MKKKLNKDGLVVYEMNTALPYIKLDKRLIDEKCQLELFCGGKHDDPLDGNFLVKITNTVNVFLETNIFNDLEICKELFTDWMSKRIKSNFGGFDISFTLTLTYDKREEYIGKYKLDLYKAEMGCFEFSKKESNANTGT